eukprot:scaffold4014_cov149-Isochrysis_galbana.AAC.2
MPNSRAASASAAQQQQQQVFSSQRGPAVPPVSGEEFFFFAPGDAILSECTDFLHPSLEPLRGKEKRNETTAASCDNGLFRRQWGRRLIGGLRRRSQPWGSEGTEAGRSKRAREEREEQARGASDEARGEVRTYVRSHTWHYRLKYERRRLSLVPATPGTRTRTHKLNKSSSSQAAAMCHSHVLASKQASV